MFPELFIKETLLELLQIFKGAKPNLYLYLLSTF